MIKYLVRITGIVIMLSVTNCNDTSDQMVNQTEPIKQFEVKELVEALNVNVSRFKEHVVAVTGFVEDVNYLNNRQTIVLRARESINTTVICDMQKDQETLLESLKSGQLVTVKGILKGSLKDVILLNCKIYNQTNQ